MIKNNPAESDELIELKQILASRSAWTSAKEIRTLQSASGNSPWDARTITFIASTSLGAIISSDAGYKLADHATEQDILDSYRISMRRAVATHHRANEMIRYARAHKLLRDDTNISKIKTDIRREVQGERTENNRGEESLVQTTSDKKPAAELFELPPQPFKRTW